MGVADRLRGIPGVPGQRRRPRREGARQRGLQARILARRAYAKGLFEDAALGEDAAADAKWVSLIGSEEAFPESLASDDALAGRVLDSEGFKARILARRAYAKGLFEDAALKEDAAADAKWVSLIGSEEAFPESLASDDALAGRVLENLKFKTLVKKKQSFSLASLGMKHFLKRLYLMPFVISISKNLQECY